MTHHPKQEPSMDTAIYPVELTVVRVLSGGNAGNGRYFYNFSPDILLCESKGTLEYTLSSDSSDGLSIRTLVHSASEKQFEAPVYAPDRRSVTIANMVTRSELINVAVIIVDIEEPRLFVKCDPQVLNIPD
ncbi:hypothetical protein ACFQGW_12880 [Xanthomonas theicola]